MKRREENFWRFLVKILPKKLMYFSYIDVVAYATTGKYSSTVVPELSAMDAVKRYGDDKNIKKSLLLLKIKKQNV